MIVVLRLIGAAESAAIAPTGKAGSSSITIVDPCQTGERAVVRALPDGSIEGVQCR
ncbi:hypothetical protein [Pseudonocardia oroxyli]|uniref:hypothetical protein n=1 Tax=Pseudonocardia oroxyli TaxID=366584 RepID=UPI00159FF746|nr:hypothetical protein [Pseudonocardia oroxyli]